MHIKSGNRNLMLRIRKDMSLIHFYNQEINLNIMSNK